MSDPQRGAAVVVVNHDTREHVLACLSTLQDAGADQVVVVDAGSSDGSVEAVRTTFPDVEVRAIANIGYGAAVNAGVLATDADVVVVANADTRFPPGSVAAMASAVRAAPDIGALGPAVRYPDGRSQASARNLPTVGEGLAHAVLGLWWPSNPWTRRYRRRDADPTRPADVDWVSGCVLAIRRTAFERVGGFDPGYFMYVEDVDLGFRLRRAGWRVRYEPSITVVHEVGASTGQRRARMVVAHARSLDRFYGRAYARGGGGALRPFVRLGLGAWILWALLWERLIGRRSGRSSTGE